MVDPGTRLLTWSSVWDGSKSRVKEEVVTMVDLLEKFRHTHTHIQDRKREEKEKKRMKNEKKKKKSKKMKKKKK